LKEEEIMKKTIATLILVFLLLTGSAWANVAGNAVEVRIVTDEGWTLPTYPHKIRHDSHKFYAEALKGDHYRIEVVNRLDRRVGLVIAVDGRNIISGAKSWLKNTERMYVLEPYGSGEYAGWRTAQNRINRFYFTDAPDSYAAAFGDESAMGVIAVAVYPEIQPCPPPVSRYFPSLNKSRERKSAGEVEHGRSDAAAVPSPSTKSLKEQASSLPADDRAGTGYGREEYSPSRIVAFEPERQSVDRIYIKYEWRSTLCRLGVLACGKPPCQAPNRLWDDYGYAPPPPGKVRP
jgi:hypothetical protein